MHQKMLALWVESDRDTLLVQRVHDTSNEEHALVRGFLGHPAFAIMRCLGRLGVSLAVDVGEVVTKVICSSTPYLSSLAMILGTGS